MDFWLSWGLLAGPGWRPAYHGSGLDELACLVLPLVLLGVVLLVVMRRTPAPTDEELPDEAGTDTASDQP